MRFAPLSERRVGLGPSVFMTDLMIDTHELTRRAEARSGVLPIAGLTRLIASLVATEGAIDWRVVGFSELAPGGSRRAFMRLSCSGVLTLACVRCLEPLSVPIQIDRSLRLVGNEAQAEREDPEDDDYDVLVGGRTFDLGALIEDELIMALPWTPHHSDCAAVTGGIA